MIGSFHTSTRKGQTGQPSDRKMVSTKLICAYCKGSHSSAHCNMVTDVKARLDIVKRERLCFNCLGTHTCKSAQCNSKNRCRICHKKHHSSLCGMDTMPGTSASESGTPQFTQTSRPVQSTLQPA